MRPCSLFLFCAPPAGVLGSPTHCRCVSSFVCRLWVGPCALNTFACPKAYLIAVTFVTLTFTAQKNGVRNETAARAIHLFVQSCCLCLAARLLHLRQGGQTLPLQFSVRSASCHLSSIRASSYLSGTALRCTRSLAQNARILDLNAILTYLHHCSSPVDSRQWSTDDRKRKNTVLLSTRIL